MPSVIDTAPAEARELVQRGEALLVDVRAGFEHAAERIPGALHHPLDAFDAEALRASSGGKPLIFHCRGGVRSRDAAQRFGGEGVRHVAGGIEAWKSAGLPTERSGSAPRLDVMRQVHIAAGTLVLAGALLAAFAHPAFVALSAFVGAGLLFAGLSGWCGMAKLLSRMPWNRVTA